MIAPRASATRRLQLAKSPPGLNTGTNRASNLTKLLNHHQKCHHENYLRPVYYIRNGMQVGGYEFFGRFTEFARIPKDNNRNLFLPPAKISEIAAHILQQTFGRKNRPNPWLNEHVNFGSISLEKRPGQIDCTRIDTKENILMRLIGTDIVEGSVYLTTAYKIILKMLENNEIPEGVASVEIEVEGNAEEYALVASPLEIRFHVPNLKNIHPSEIYPYIKDKITELVRNKSPLSVIE